MPTLNWIGKEAVLEHHKEVPFHLLRCDPELSVGDPGSGNLLIQGDNLLAVKALLPYYAGKVKCIYIDPPYNTGNENWMYNDNVNSPEIKEWLGQIVGSESEDLSRQDKWLCMMHPRLVLLQQLLSEDGAIFISIDDNSFANLRYLMNDIFGYKNFVATITWQKIYTIKNSAKYLSEMHDYVLIYAKSKDNWKRNLRPRTEATDQDYKNPDDDPNGPWISHALQSRNFYSKGTYSISCPGGRIIDGPPPGTYWRVSEKNFWKTVKREKVWWGKDGNASPRIKEYLKDAKKGIVPSTWWPYQFAGTNSGAKVALRRMIGDYKMFITPKPVELVSRILELSSDKDDLILDSFAGSGTTGHAVMQINKEDNGNRRFILVEMEKEIAQKITSKRLLKAIEGYAWEGQRGKLNEVEGLGGSFRYCTLDAPLFDASGQINSEVTYSDLARHVYFTETGEPLPPSTQADSPQLGVVNGRAIYLLFNGILGDKSENGGNVLTRQILAGLPPHAGPKVIYGEGCLLSDAFLQSENITFRQLPYEVKTS